MLRIIALLEPVVFFCRASCWDQERELGRSRRSRREDTGQRDVPGGGLRRAGARGGDVPGARAVPVLRRRGGSGRRGEHAAALLRSALLPHPTPLLLLPLLTSPERSPEQEGRHADATELCLAARCQALCTYALMEYFSKVPRIPHVLKPFV